MFPPPESSVPQPKDEPTPFYGSTKKCLDELAESLATLAVMEPAARKYIIEQLDPAWRDKLLVSLNDVEVDELDKFMDENDPGVI